MALVSRKLRWPETMLAATCIHISRNRCPFLCICPQTCAHSREYRAVIGLKNTRQFKKEIQDVVGSLRLARTGSRTRFAGRLAVKNDRVPFATWR
jgi:hypothetical protein